MGQDIGGPVSLEMKPGVLSGLPCLLLRVLNPVLVAADLLLVRSGVEEVVVPLRHAGLPLLSVSTAATPEGLWKVGVTVQVPCLAVGAYV